MGTKRIGVAVNPPGTSLAIPLNPIDRQNIKLDLAAILAIINERAVTTVVVGDPLNMSGERGIAAEKIDRFVESLRECWSGEILRVDERLTTAQSTRALIEADVSRAKRKRLVDGMAAALILESYLRRR
jgi:putative Holliday junction resolvase